MNKREVLEIADQADHETMVKVAVAMSLVQKESPEFVEEIAAELDAIVAHTQDGVQKLAGVADKALMGAAVLGTGAAMTLGGSVAADLYDAARRGLTKSRNFRRIMIANPDLDKKVNDPKRLKAAYTTLHRYAPDMTSDPMLGGAILSVMGRMEPELLPDYMERLIKTRGTLTDVKRNQFGVHGTFGVAQKMMEPERLRR
jgi:hypothetical protein